MYEVKRGRIAADEALTGWPPGGDDDDLARADPRVSTSRRRAAWAVAQDLATSRDRTSAAAGRAVLDTYLARGSSLRHLRPAPHHVTGTLPSQAFTLITEIWQQGSAADPGRLERLPGLGEWPGTAIR
ncbi:hypothetical protein ACRAKI_18240 [Saccharothrix isguenensis]